MTRGLSNPEVRSLRPGENKKIDFNRLFKRKTTFAEIFTDFQLRFFSAIFLQSFLESLKTAITSAVFAITSAVFDRSL